MVPHDGPAAKTTAVVSFHEERNKIAEIPRVDPADKPNLWISKVEIHHNTMMTKIRGLVQEKLFELVAKDESFFNGIEDLPMELDDMEVWQEQKKPRPETEEEILLAKKAQVLQDLLNAIMDLPKDEILSFLTSNTLPIGLQRPSSSTKSSPGEPQQGPQAQKRSTAGPTDPAAQKARVSASIARAMGSENYYYDNAQKQEEDQTHADYNWILDCDDAWEDLPAVVKINAIELGYNERLWDEDAQDMPIFRTLWKTLSPNQKTAAVFLGNYTEQSWNEDVRMLVMAGKPPSLASIVDDEDDQAPSSKPSPEEANDDDDDDMFSEFLSNFASEDSDEEDEPVVVERFQDEEEDDDDDDDSEAMMDEFLANFGGSTDTGDQSTLEKETSVDAILMEDDDDEDDSEAMMDEFMANFGGSTDSGVETTQQKESTANVVPIDDEDDSEAMMDEFLSNFVETSNEEDETESDKKETSESEASGKDDDDGEEAMMDEFLSNFVDYSEEKEIPAKETPVATRSVVPEEEDDEDAMMDEFMSNFVEPSNEEEETESTTDVDGGSTPSPALEEETKADDDAAMMNEFVSNFVAPADQEIMSSDPQPVGLVPNYQSVRDDGAEETFDDEHEASDGSDEEQPLVPSSSPTGATMNRGFSGETSPLLASSTTETTTTEPESEPQTYWESVSSYLYWIPVVVGLPVVYSMVAGGSEA